MWKGFKPENQNFSPTGEDYSNEISLTQPGHEIKVSEALQRLRTGNPVDRTLGYFDEIEGVTPVELDKMTKIEKLQFINSNRKAIINYQNQINEFEQQQQSEGGKPQRTKSGKQPQADPGTQSEGTAGTRAQDDK